jgi:predicted metalloprotease with PDZ domain
MGGIQNGGWKLTYNATRPDLFRADEEEHRNYDFRYSIGLIVKEEGRVQDVIVGSPAYKAGIAPDDKVIAINNRAFAGNLVREAIDATASGPAPLEFLIKRGEFFSVHKVEYQGGSKYPHLERDESKPDLLSKIMDPLVKK